MGLGEIDVTSQLNQRFSATIPLTDVSLDEAENLQVGLASNDSYARNGLDRSDYLSTLSFKVDTSSGAAQGVGLRLIQRNNPQQPVVFSTSTTSRGNATLLFNVAAGGALSKTFTLPMAASYYVWAPAKVSQGKLNTTATLNIIYP